MLFARALSNGARWFCAGIFGGSVYTHEELGIATDEEGRALEPEASDGDGNELCTKQQREEIRRLVAAAGMDEKQHLADLGVQLLDELSGYEADKEIRKLAKKADKAAAKELTRVIPSDPDPRMKPGTIGPAQQMIADAFDAAAKPSTAEQRQQILSLAERLIHDEGVRYEKLKEALARKGKSKISELDYLAAAAWIEDLQDKLASPPFEPAPEKPGTIDGIPY